MDACEKYLGGSQEGQKCLNRTIKHINKGRDGCRENNRGA